MFALTQKPGECLWIGLSSEPRPDAVAGHVLFELDTNKSYVVSAGNFAFAPSCTFGGGSAAWADITGKPSSYPPEAHSQSIGSVTGLQGAIDAKQAAGSYQPLSTVLTNATAAFTTAQETKLAGVATGATANATDANLRDRASHTGAQAIATVTGLQTALDGKAALAHGHAIGDTTGLQAALDAKQAALVSATNIKTVNGSSLLGTGNLAVSGTDAWTYVKLAADFPTSSATAVDITGLAFTPLANTQYEFEALLLLRTATATVGPRPGLAWPTGMTDGVADLNMPTAATTQVMVFGNPNAALLAAVGGLPNTTQSYPARVGGTLLAGASPSGTLKLQLASETAGTVVTAKAGSFIKWRTI